jgi:hypothetical protein
VAQRQVVRTWIILGTPYDVVRTEDLQSPSHEGEYLSTHGEIRIMPDVPPQRFWPVEQHELGHAVSHALGMARSLRDNFGLSQEAADKIEEEWIAKFLPVYLDTLQRGGIVLPPPMPVFVDEVPS